MKKVTEFLKSILIVLLTLAVIVLVVLSLPTKTLTAAPRLAAVLRPFAGVLGISEAELTDTVPAAETQITAAAQPVAMSVNAPAGRRSFLYDFAALDAAYEQLGHLLGQALDSAENGSVTDKNSLQTALSGQSVFLAYPGTLPAAALGAWLHTAAPEERASSFVLSLEREQVALYLAGEKVIRYDTAADAAEFSEVLARYTPDGSRFAFEESSGLYAGLDPLCLLPGALPKLAAATIGNPCDSRFVSALATALGFNPYGDARYVDDAGNTAFTEPGCSLTVTAAGDVQLRTAGDSRFRCADNSCTGQIEAARALLDTVAGNSFGAARLYLTDYEQTETGAICRFDYCLAGLPVSAGSGRAAVVTVENGAIVSLQLSVRRYAFAGDAVSLLPAAQAAAIASPGASLHLVYTEGGDGTLTPTWAAE